MQLRGVRLKEYLEAKLGELVGSYAARSEVYVYSQKEFAFYASVSRETVRKYQSIIDAFLMAGRITKKGFDKDARVNNLQAKVLKLQGDLSRSQAMYEAIRLQYIEIMESLLSHSIDVQALVVPPAEVSNCQRLYRMCVLCGQDVPPRQDSCRVS